jgi:predicted transcriptional regulator
MKSITIRGIDSELDRAIKERASHNSQSVNQWLLQALKKMTGTAKQPVYAHYHDLDELAGGWTARETREFFSNIEMFEKIDEDVWK